MSAKPVLADRPRYNEEKVTEATSILLNLHGGEMSYLKLLKLLYLADRKALQEWERPISNDRYVSMDRGPNLSITYNLIMDSFPGLGEYWHEHISERKNYRIHLKGEGLKIRKLSQAEVDTLEKVYEEFGKLSRWDLVRLCHDLPEYQDPEGSSIPIEMNELLQALGFDEEDIHRIEEENREEASLESILGN